MSRTDKDLPYQYRDPDGNYYGPPFSTNFRKGKAIIKREGNKRYRRSFKQPRYARCPFYDYKTVRTELYFM